VNKPRAYRARSLGHRSRGAMPSSCLRKRSI
jgi:hypothetical protein